MIAGTKDPLKTVRFLTNLLKAIERVAMPQLGDGAIGWSARKKPWVAMWRMRGADSSDDAILGVILLETIHTAIQKPLRFTDEGKRCPVDRVRMQF